MGSIPLVPIERFGNEFFFCLERPLHHSFSPRKHLLVLRLKGVQIFSKVMKPRLGVRQDLWRARERAVRYDLANLPITVAFSVEYLGSWQDVHRAGIFQLNATPLATLAH